MKVKLLIEALSGQTARCGYQIFSNKGLAGHKSIKVYKSPNKTNVESIMQFHSIMCAMNYIKRNLPHTSGIEFQTLGELKFKSPKGKICLNFVNEIAKSLQTKNCKIIYKKA